jgi:hypothetical protein
MVEEQARPARQVQEMEIDMDVIRVELAVVVELDMEPVDAEDSSHIVRVAWFHMELVVGLDEMEFPMHPLPDQIGYLNP